LWNSILMPTPVLVHLLSIAIMVEPEGQYQSLSKRDVARNQKATVEAESAYSNSLTAEGPYRHFTSQPQDGEARPTSLRWGLFVMSLRRKSQSTHSKESAQSQSETCSATSPGCFRSSSLIIIFLAIPMNEQVG